MWKWEATLDVQELYQWMLWLWVKLMQGLDLIEEWSKAKHCMKMWYSDSQVVCGKVCTI
mgnify:CR=1 FL=1